MAEKDDRQGYAGTAAALEREWGSVTELLEGLDRVDWERPTRCAGWTIMDLARHVVWGVSMEVDALRRARAGESDPADGHTLPADSSPQAVLEALRAAAADLEAEVRTLGADAEARICPMPYGDTPLPVALDVFVFEAAIHASDFAHAVGKERPLAEDTVPPTATVLSVFLPAFAAAGQVPPDGTSFSLRGGTVVLDGEWSGPGLVMRDSGAESTLTVSGDDSSVLLYAVGRLGIDDPRLEAEGSTELARDFKVYAPGP